MATSNQPVIKIAELEQVCIVVNDIDKKMKQIWETFGIGPWDIYVNTPDSVRDMTYYGKPARFGYEVARTHNKVGGIEIELIHPTEGETIWGDHLREYGESVHHLAWHKVKSLEAFAETKRRLEAAGFPCVMSGRSFRAFAYYDTSRVLGTMLEVVHFDPSVVGQPARIFPSR